MTKLSLKFPVLLVALAASAAAGCTSEQAPVDEDSADQLAAAQDELRFVQGPLVLQSTNLVKSIYQAQARQWVRWVMKLPWSTGPVKDTTGAACMQGQRGPVWFLAGTTGGPVQRTCTIPRNKFLFFPLVNDWVTPPDEDTDTPTELKDAQDFVKEYFKEARSDTCGLKLKVDGREILADSAARAAALDVHNLNPFSLVMHADNTGSEFGFPGGHFSRVWARGHYALLLPLSVGTHTVEFGGQHCNATDGVYFETSAIYTLHVTP